MLISEFNALTGIYPSWLLWKVINRVYNESQLDKHEWCAAYVANKDGMAKMIARLADTEYERQATDQEMKTKNAHCEIMNLKKQLEKVKAQLDSELEWHPTDKIGTNMSESDYQLLAEDTAPMSELDAIRRIAHEFGFDMSCIKLVQTVETFDVNKHQKCRVSGTFSRLPVWESTYQNYIRFDVCDKSISSQWEIVNGQLHAYYD